jgi:hypothetical protein
MLVGFHEDSNRVERPGHLLVVHGGIQGSGAALRAVQAGRGRAGSSEISARLNPSAFAEGQAARSCF